MSADEPRWDLDAFLCLKVSYLEALTHVGQLLPVKHRRQHILRRWTRLCLTIVLGVLAVVFCFAVLQYLAGRGPFVSQENISRTRVGIVKGMQERDVVRMVIYRSSHPRTLVILNKKTDPQDIRRLLYSAQHIRIDRHTAWMASDDVVEVSTRRGKVVIHGHFDPDRSPVIAPNMRSDDFARIVQDITNRKKAPSKGR